MTDPDSLRRHLKKTRNGIPGEVAQRNAELALQRLHSFIRLRRARRIAGYIGHAGEIDPLPLLATLQRRTPTYLPVLHPLHPGRLWFCRWQPGDVLRENRFGIPEPDCRTRGQLAAQHLDIVITPLLGFDAACHRMGMGGGYYDRTFAFLRARRFTNRPLLIGLAHEVQRVEHIEPNTWDVNLDAVVTEQHIYVAPTRR